MRVAGQQRSQAGVGRHDVVGTESERGERVARRLEQVGDVGAAGADLVADPRAARGRQGGREVGVGRPDDRAGPGRQDEVEAVVLRRAQHECSSAMRHARGVEDQVHPQRGTQAAPAGEKAVGERAGRADDQARLDLEARAGLAVDDQGAPRAAAAIARDPLDSQMVGAAAPAASASSTFSSTRRASSVWQST